MQNLLNIAIDLANKQMADMYDRSGFPAILHPIRVMLKSTDTDGQIVGIMHDLIEDTDVSLEYLKDCGFPEHIIAAIDAVSRRKGETYKAFIERIAASGKLAVRVKLNDLADNLERVRNLPEGAGLEHRYKQAQKRLMEVWGD